MEGISRHLGCPNCGSSSEIRYVVAQKTYSGMAEEIVLFLGRISFKGDVFSMATPLEGPLEQTPQLVNEANLGLFHA